MSEMKTDVPELSLLEQLRLQHMQFIQQKELAQNNLNQLVGAAYACEIMIRKHEDEASKNPAGDPGNGEADKQTEEQTTPK